MNLKRLESYLRVNLLGPGPRVIKKNLPGRDLTKVEKHWCRGGAELQLHSFLTTALDGGEWSTSCPCRFPPTTPRKNCSTSGIVGCVGPKACLDGFGDENTFLPLPGFERGPG